jgi:hypothetical protein
MRVSCRHLHKGQSTPGSHESWACPLQIMAQQQRGEGRGGEGGGRGESTRVEKEPFLHSANSGNAEMGNSSAAAPVLPPGRVLAVAETSTFTARGRVASSWVSGGEWEEAGGGDVSVQVGEGAP